MYQIITMYKYNYFVNYTSVKLEKESLGLGNHTKPLGLDSVEM